MLVCEQCGCSGELGMGWVSFVRGDLDEVEAAWTGAFCPPCAAARFGHRPDLAEHYVCVWEPPRSEGVEAPTGPGSFVSEDGR